MNIEKSLKVSIGIRVRDFAGFTPNYWHSRPPFVRRSDTSMIGIISQAVGGTISSRQGCHGASLLPDTFQKKCLALVEDRCDNDPRLYKILVKVN